MEGIFLKTTFAKFPRCPFVSSFFEDSSKSRNWKEKHVLFYDTMKTFVQQIDVIISLCWIHYSILQSGCRSFLNFCTFSLLESTKRMVLKASFQTLQGVLLFEFTSPFPLHPWHQTQPYKSVQTGRRDEVSRGCANFLSQLCPPRPCEHFSPHTNGISTALRNKTLYINQMAFWDSYNRHAPHFHFT